MTKEEEITDLKAKLKAREGRPGFKANSEAIQARIARLEREIADGV